MPELPEVETVCRGLRPPLEGRLLTRVVQRRPDLRFPIPEGFVERLTGRRVMRVERRAKYILMTFDDDTVLMAHLGMSGRMTIVEAVSAPPAGPHDHVEFETDQGVLIRYCDPRRFGMMDLTTVQALGEHRLLKKLGPEPLGNAFNASVLDFGACRKENANQSGASGPAYRRRVGEYLYMRGPASGGYFTAAGGRDDTRRTIGAAGPRNQGGAGRCDRRWGIVVARLRPGIRRSWIFSASLAGLWPGGRALPAS